MAGSTPPAYVGLQSLFDQSRAAQQQQAAQQNAPVGGAAGVAQPYDPVTGLPTTPSSTTGPSLASSIAGGASTASTTPLPGSMLPAGAPPVAAGADANGPTTESRSGARHFGASMPGTDPNAGTTPTQTGPQNYLEDAYKQLGGAYLGPSYMDSSVGGLQSQLAQPGQAEQFYQQAQNTATDPYYQRLRQQGSDALNQQMAARGNYNSGGAIAGLGNFDSGLAAQQYSQMGQLAQNAQNGQNARVGLSGQLASSADQGDLSKLNSFFNTAGQAQGANQQGINSMLSAQMGINNNASGLMSGFYGAGGQLSGQALTDAINAMIQSGQASAQGQQAQQGQMMGLTSLGLGAL